MNFKNFRCLGAQLAKIVAGASNINKEKEWTAIEDSLVKGNRYMFPKIKKGYAGIVLTLSKFQHPDLSSFSDMEVCFRVTLDYHAGLIVKSDSSESVLELLDDYANRLTADFATVIEQKKLISCINKLKL